MKETLGRIHSIETFGAIDGPGIRYIVFLQGCPMRCIYCHNPDTWEYNSDKLMKPSQVMKDILKYSNFISKGGVTISGGEPLLQSEFCKELIKLCHENKLHCAIDTSGSIGLDECKEAIDIADLIILDIKSLDEEIYKKITGQSHINAIKILDYCESIEKDVWIRHVVVPGVTLKDDKLNDIADFVKKYTCIKRVELLPFHKMGEYKWEAMGIKSPLEETLTPTEEEMDNARELFRAKGINIK